MDSLIVTDMITLARNRAMASCVLLCGDEDLRVGVQQVQEHGVRVHLLGVGRVENQSGFLKQEADNTHKWLMNVLTEFLECRPPEPTPAGPLAPDPGQEIADTADVLQQAARRVGGPSGRRVDQRDPNP